MIAENCVDRESCSDDLCSYLLFYVGEHIFSIKITDIFKLQKTDSPILAIPNTPEYIRGSLKINEDLYSVVDLCQLFGWKSAAQEFQELCEMIDARKQDHIRWVRELKKSYISKTPFTLPKNRHDCALGRWRDNYTSTNFVTQHLLAHLDAPHEKLHALADDVLKHEERSSFAMEEIETVWMPCVLKALDQMKIQFQEQMTREIFILIRHKVNLAIVAEAALCIEPMQKRSACDATLIPNHKAFVKNIFQRDAELILELDISTVIEKLRMEEERGCDTNLTSDGKQERNRL